MKEAPLSSQAIQELASIDSPTVANAIEHFKVRDQVTGFASMDLRCQFPDYQPMVGYAVTCTGDTTTAGDDRPQRMHDLFDLIQEAPKPTVLVIKYIGSDRLRSCFVGDMVCTALQKLGAAGVVTDGGIRDAKGIQTKAPGFQLFSPGAVVSHGFGVFVELDLTVSVAGLTIQPGDLLHGDESGLLKVPLEIADSVAEQAKAVRKRESEFFEYIESDSFSPEGLKGRIGRH